MERKNEAINLFKKRYGKTPEESGMPEIDIYEKQGAFLYADSKEVIKAYKIQQNILRWMMSWLVWPMVVALLVWLIAVTKYQNIWHPLCLLSYIFVSVWAVVVIVLSLKFKQTNRLVKMGNNMTYLNYGK